MTDRYPRIFLLAILAVAAFAQAGCQRDLKAIGLTPEAWFEDRLTDDEFEGQDLKVNPSDAVVDAKDSLLQGAERPNFRVRIYSLEAIGSTLKPADASILEDCLSDPKVMVRYAAAMAIGDMVYTKAKPKLIAMLDNPDTDQRVACAAIYALARMGDYTYAPELGDMLFSDFKYGRSCAAISMGKMGGKSAIEPLKTLLGEEKDQNVRYSIYEALARLGDKKAVDSLEAYTTAGYYMDLKIPAIPLLAEIKAPKAKRIFADLYEQSAHPPRIRVAACGALGKMGVFKREYYEYCQKAAEDPETVLKEFYGTEQVDYMKISSLQRLAAMAIGDMGKIYGINVLHPMLVSDDGAVRISAAWGILKLVEGKKSNFETIEPVKTNKNNPKKHKPVITTGGID